MQPTAADLSNLLHHEAHTFLQPSRDLHESFLRLAKIYLDPVASRVTEVQRARQIEERQSRKRKRRPRDVGGERPEFLRMKRVHVEGFDVDQVWQQARRVISAAYDETERQLNDDQMNLKEVNGAEKERRDKTQGPNGVKRVSFVEDGSEAGVSDEESIEEEDVDEQYAGYDLSDDEEDGDKVIEGRNLAHSDNESLNSGRETPPTEISDEEDEEEEQQPEEFIEDKHGLNDGFFSIDQFNKQSQFLEQQDARGDPDDGAASDEEDIDWTVDPLALNPQPETRQNRKNRQEGARKQNNVVQYDEDEGPTFGDADLYAADDESDLDDALEGGVGAMGDEEFSNTNNITYADFFAPPAKKAGKKPKANHRKVRFATNENTYNAPPSASAAKDAANEEYGDLKRTISAVHRDLFEDHLSEDEASDANASKGARKSNLSSHERAQLALRAEIRRLEAANVASKPWSMTGETVAQSRPLNSLLEEDLEFERAGKPVPVITEEVSEDIESLIKRRILDRNFDEVVRRRPNDLVTGGADPRRGRAHRDDVEVADTKPSRGLAEEYEQEHLRRTDPNFAEPRSEALKAAHKQIEAHWASVSAQLDALCNWHYKPKPAAAGLEVRVDAPTISMEDARPSGGGDVAGASMLAPQEVYRPGDEGKVAGEVQTKGGTVVAREEETRDQRRRRRRREKERGKKANSNAIQPGSSHNGASVTVKGGKKNIADVEGELKKGGAKIIDRKGVVRDVTGKAVTDRSTVAGAETFKL